MNDAFWSAHRVCEESVCSRFTLTCKLYKKERKKERKKEKVPFDIKNVPLSHRNKSLRRNKEQGGSGCDGQLKRNKRKRRWVHSRPFEGNSFSLLIALLCHRQLRYLIQEKNWFTLAGRASTRLNDNIIIFVNTLHHRSSDRTALLLPPPLLPPLLQVRRVKKA